MRKTAKVVMGMVLCVFSLLTVIPSVGVKAEELDTPVSIDQDSPYENVYAANCWLTIYSGQAYVSSKVEGYTGTSSTSVTVYLEKFVGGSWQSYMSWSHSGGRVQENTDTISVTSGAYRVWMSVTASGIGGSESFNVDGNTAGC